jgi:hypothetical protein
MGSRVTLKVGALNVAMVGDKALAKELPVKLQQAFELLAKRLAAAPLGRGAAPESLVLDRVELAPFALDELIGPRGAERIAEELYRRMTGA